MTDVLELIDNAIAGTTGPDAMRWLPEPPEGVPPVDIEQTRATFRAGARFTAMIEALQPAMQAWVRQISAAGDWAAKVIPIIEQADAAKRVRVSRMHAAYGRRRR